MGEWCPCGPSEIHTWEEPVSDMFELLGEDSYRKCIWCGIAYHDAFPAQDVEGE